MSVANNLVKQLELEAHPEGGFYRRTYQSDKILMINTKDRYCSTLIYYLLKENGKSKFHRLKSDEIWIYQLGTGIKIHHLHPNGSYEIKELGNRIEKGQHLQVLVPVGTWFAAEMIEPSSYCLTSCMVTPGFDFEDFEMANRELLLQHYHEHKEIIERFT